MDPEKTHWLVEENPSSRHPDWTRVQCEFLGVSDMGRSDLKDGASILLGQALCRKAMRLAPPWAVQVDKDE